MPLARSSVGGVKTTSGGEASENSYSTGFDLTENPINESGRWLNGSDMGEPGDFQDVQTGSGLAYGSGTSSNFHDNLAVLVTPTLPVDHEIIGVINRAGGYNPGVGHEIELLLRCDEAQFYEVLLPYNTAAIQIIKQSGSWATFEDITDGGGEFPILVDGDVVRAVARNTDGGTTVTIDVYVNGVLEHTTVDASSPYLTNTQAGHGYYPTPGSTLSSFSLKSWYGGPAT